MKRKAGISNKFAQKSKSLTNYQSRQARDEQRARKRAADEEHKLMREREAHERRLSSFLRSRVEIAQLPSSGNSPVEKYDFFVAHASEDKKLFVRPLAKLLRSKGARVWYDEFTLELGDSLRRKIDQGLVDSRFEIVVLSEYFFKIADAAIMDALDKQIRPLYRRVAANEGGSHLLAAHRETLLPKLMSGQVPVRDAEPSSPGEAL